MPEKASNALERLQNIRFGTDPDSPTIEVLSLNNDTRTSAEIAAEKLYEENIALEYEKREGGS